MSALRRYLAVLREVRATRGEMCETCGQPAHYPHHILPVGRTSICSELVYDPANILLLCDDCHALMHPLLRNVAEWGRARKDRGQILNRPN